MQLLSACERHFGFVMPSRDLAALKSVADAVSYCQARLEER